MAAVGRNGAARLQTVYDKLHPDYDQFSMQQLHLTYLYLACTFKYCNISITQYVVVAFQINGITLNNLL